MGPAPIAYIKVVAVKKLVVELQVWLGGLLNGMYCLAESYFLVSRCALHWCALGNQDFYLEKIRVLPCFILIKKIISDLHKTAVYVSIITHNVFFLHVCIKELDPHIFPF